MSKVSLTEANTADTATINRLATKIWNQHYPPIIGQQQVNYMLQLMYSLPSLSEQLEKKGHRFFLIRNASDTVGFLSLSPEGEQDWFLNKFYIDQELAGKGLGAEAFGAMIKIISPKKITLTVNRQNFKSINFYFKMGFKIERVADFDIGDGYVMNDFVMVWNAS